MEKIGNYRILERIAETRGSLIYRGEDEASGQAVTIKVLKAQYPSPAETARFKKEYEMIRQADIGGVLKTLEIIPHQSSFALVLEYFNAINLKDYAERQKPDTGIFLEIATQLAATLGNLHKKNIVHRDIKPHNILINPGTHEVKITDFGIAAELTGENTEVFDPDVISGTLLYMSPEQTGRMNRPVDYRTDLYSLGVTLYYLLTGRVPFMSDDPLEIIHAHIAKNPVPPDEYAPGLPGIFSAMIAKLMAKTAEERYQNAFGLLYDLHICREHLAKEGYIPDFELGSKDISIMFNIPQRMFGREHELDLLMQSFERTAGGGREAILVSGHPGIGKSALIQEIYKPITARKGYFISGKYEQFRRDVPYSALIQAFKRLMRQILSEDEARVDTFRKKILAALGANAKIITDEIPEMELITGTQPDVPALEPEEARNRFNLVFRQFIRIFCTREHPLVLFLDDLQWADAATEQLIKTIMTDPDQQYFLLIAAYRDTEMGPAGPFPRTMQEIRKQGLPLTTIHLDALHAGHVAGLIANFLRCPLESAQSLAELVHAKTGGNPFFINQFLKTLHEEHLLKLDQATGWSWDMTQIAAMQVTDNVVELLAAKIANLPESTLKIMQVCSVAGDRFDLELIADILKISIELALDHLSEAIATGFISRVEEGYMFHHDRIQEAVYSLITAEERKRLHYRIGNIYLARTSQAALPERIFDIVNQLNQGAGLIREQTEKNTLARLNLMAGEKARNSNAYGAAATYTKAGIDLLPEDAWDAHYDMCYALHLGGMQCEYLSYRFDEAEQYFDVINRHARGQGDKARAYSLMIYLKISRAEYEQALNLGLEYLALAGIILPRHPTKLDIMLKLFALWRAMRGHKVEDLMKLPKIDTLEKIAHNQVYMAVNYPAYFLDANLFAILAIQRNLDNLWEGTLETSGTSLIVLSTILGPGMGLYKTAKRFMDVAGHMMRQYPDSKDEVPFVFGSAFLLDHWYGHARHNIEKMRLSHRLALQHGDLIVGLHSVINVAMSRMFSGDNLDEIFAEMLQYENIHKIAEDDFATRSYQNQLQFYHSLKGLTASRTSLNDAQFDTDEHTRAYQSRKNILGLFFLLLNQLKLFSLFGEYERGLQTAGEMSRIADVALGTLSLVEFYFFQALCAAGKYPDAARQERQRLRRLTARSLKKMQNWSKLCAQNFQHKYYLILAEKLAWMDNQPDKALYYYEKAISAARTNAFINDEALAAELAGRFFQAHGYEELCKSSMYTAWQAYRSWGASTKVLDLEERYPHLIERGAHRDVSGTDTWEHSSTGSKSQVLERVDLRTVIKSSQALSGEIDLDRLIERLLAIAMENAAAQSGALLLERAGELRMEARAGLNEALPMSIINYVRRTGDFVLLGNAMQDETFGRDQSVAARGIQSVLCLPVKEQTHLIGILYLENNLAQDTFTPERIEVLEILTSQAAISIKNALLYAERTLAQEQLLAEKERLSVTLRSIGDGVIATDTQGRITLMNKVAEELSGWTQEQVQDKPFSEVLCLFDSQTGKSCVNPLMELLSSGKNAELNYKPVLQSLSGQERMVELSTSPIWEQGRIIGAIVVFRDITQKHKMEEELLKTQKLESLSIFAGGIAHDFNNLLTGIIGNASLVLHQADPDTLLYKRLSMLEKTGLRAKNLTQQLLTFAKGGNPVRKNMRINELIKESAQFALSGSSISSEFAIADTLWSAEVDEGQINQVMNNLVINAVQAMPEGGKLRIRAENVHLTESGNLPLPPGKYIRISVEDEGVGIPEDHLAKIFDPFFTTKAKGNGLGLSSTFSIIQKHGGHIGAGSQPGAGTTFTIHLPASKEISAAQHVEDRTDFNLGPGRVLLMDDDETIRATGRDILNQLGFSVETAVEGSEAIEIYKAALEQGARFDFLILDLTIPGGWGGVEVVRRLKHIDPEVKTIASSGYSNDPVLADYASYGFNGIIVKPYLVSEMAQAIGKIKT